METEQKNKGKVSKAAVILALFIAVGFTMYLKRINANKQAEAKTQAEHVETAKTNVTKPLPKLIELGAGKCMACKSMKPVLEELKKQFSDKLNIENIDVWQNQEIAKSYKIDLIPTQIFLDPQGKEIFRHQGFFAKDDIIKKWQELGYLKSNAE